jgi:hypothetical protein
MIDYKYPTIASGATPIGSAGRAPDEELLREGRGRKFWVHGLEISLPSGVRIQEPEDFRKSKSWSKKLEKSKISGSQSVKKSKFEEVKDWRNQIFLEVKVIWSQRLKHLKVDEDLKFWRLNPNLQLELSLGGYWRGYALQVLTD